MGTSGKHRPAATRLRLILVASGVAVAVLAAGAVALFTGNGSAEKASAAQTAPVPTASDTQQAVPLADAPRPTPTRASRGKHRSPAPKPTRTHKPKPKPTKKKPVRPKSERVLSSGSCEASYYWEGQMTASGERFNPSELTAAHKTLPMNSRVRVTNKNNGRSVVVRINDRGPYAGGRCLDLSKAAMIKVGGTGAGVIPVRYQVLARS